MGAVLYGTLENPVKRERVHPHVPVELEPGKVAGGDVATKTVDVYIIRFRTSIFYDMVC
jgi:hypothetical protein